MAPLGAELSPRRAADDILPRVTTSICTVSLERSPALTFDLLRVTAHDRPYTDGDDLPRSLQMCGAALERGKPLLVLYDFSDARMPPIFSASVLLRPCVQWADAHARPWDRQVQGLVVVLANPLIRNFLSMLNAILKPPQPIAYCADTTEAMAFLVGIREARSYEKASYPPAPRDV